MILVGAAAAAAAQTAWREAAEYLALVAPAAHRQAYATSVTTADLDAVLAGLSGDPSLARTPGAWQPQRMNVRDALGTAGTYNRWSVARLYGAQQPRVARGARLDRGQVVEAWTLISPYPSADLRRLEPGTLRIIVRIAP